MSLKNCIFLRTVWPAKKTVSFFKMYTVVLTVSYSLRGLPRKILGTCFSDFFDMFGIVCQMPAASGDAHKRQSE